MSTSSVVVVSILFSEGYDFDTFKKLEPHHLRELIPMPPQRVLFELKLNELKKSFDQGNLPDEADRQLANNNDVEVVNQSLDADEDEYDVRLECFTDEDGILKSNDVIIAASVPSSSQPTASPSTHDETFDSENLPQTYSKVSESPMFKDMHDLDMEIVCARFAKNGFLEATDRGKVSRCIIKFMLQKSKDKM